MKLYRWLRMKYWQWKMNRLLRKARRSYSTLQGLLGEAMIVNLNDLMSNVENMSKDIKQRLT